MGRPNRDPTLAMTTDDLIAELLIRWEEAWDHGAEIPVETLCAEHPELVDAVRPRIEALRAAAWMKALHSTATADQAEEPEHEQTPPSPTLLGNRYRIDGLIAEGGHGRVYRGFDTELQRPVAIKVARTARPGGSPSSDTLRDEARRVARLRHPGIVPVHDIGRDQGLTYIVSELVEGETLADRIARQRPAPVQSIRWIAAVAEALAFAHEQGVVHRDLKPANLLIDRQGRPLVTDFGIAITRDCQPGQIAATSGTLAYRAPEQVAGEAQLIDPRTDLYALGVVLYELLAGRSPYAARTPHALREQILFRPPVPLDCARPGIGPELEQLVQRCLAKHPADRPPSALAVAQALRTGPGRPRRRTNRFSASIALAAVAGLATGSLATWHGSRPRTSENSAARASAPNHAPRVQPATEVERNRPAIDLLRLIDPRTHAVGPSWTRDGAALVSPPDERARIAIPYQPPRSYLLRVVVQRVRGMDAVVFGLTTGPNQVAAIFDTGPGEVSGLALLDGEHLSNVRNETRHVEGLIPIDRPMRFECVVRESGIHVQADGRTIIDWPGAAERLSLPEPWAMPRPGWLFVGSQQGIVRFDAIELIPLDD